MGVPSSSSGALRITVGDPAASRTTTVKAPLGARPRSRATASGRWPRLVVARRSAAAAERRLYVGDPQIREVTGQLTDRRQMPGHLAH